MSLFLSRDDLRKGGIDSAQGARGFMCSSSIDGRTNNVIPNEYPPPDPCIYAWEPTLVKTEDGDDYITLEPGTISPTPTTGGGATISSGGSDVSIFAYPRPQLKVPYALDTTQIIYLKLENVTETLDDGYMVGCVIGTAKITVSATPLTSTIGTTSTIYLELFRWRNHFLESQATRYNVGLFGRGLSGAGVFSFTYSGAIA